MANYLLSFHGEMGPMPEDPAEFQASMAKWGAWYESMAEAVVDHGAPISHSTAIGADGAATDAPATLSGYTIVSAPDMAAATAFAQGCPVLENGHSVQISECIDMSQ